MSTALRVCIIQPNCETYSERLLRDQLERLPADVTVLCNGWFPTRTLAGDPFLTPLLSIATRAASRIDPRAARYVATRGLAIYLRNQAIDVVLAQYGPTGAAVLDACQLAGVPLVVQFHGFDAYDRQTLDEQREGYRKLFDGAAAMVAVSRAMAGRLVSLGAPADKLRCIPGGVDCAFFNGADPARAPETFVSIGRFVEKKAPHVTLQAFAHVVKARPDATLVMIGDGRVLDQSRDLAASLGIASSVEFRGPVDRAGVLAALKSARAFVMHSIEAPGGDSEGTPIALLEAGAAGLPAVATRHAGIAEVIRDGETGYLVEEGDAETMAARMIDLARDADRAARLGAQARSRVAVHYSIDHNIAALAETISDAARR